jgi:RNA polymerase sigma-70 factor (ECF subfamily)
MSKPAVSEPVQAATRAPGAPAPEDVLFCAFNEVRDELVSTLWFLLGNREDARDIAQEAFLRCWRNQATVPDIRNLRAWIFKVSLNAARDLQRSAWRRRVKPLLGEEAMLIDDGASVEQELEDQETLTRIRVALHDLRPEEKEVFLLRENGELTYEQIAELFNRPIGTVKTQMRTALQKLRRVLA